MKILFFSDLHRDHQVISHIKAQLAKVEMGFGLGDFATFRKGLTETLELLVSSTELYFIPGNHDDAEELKWLLPRA